MTEVDEIGEKCKGQEYGRLRSHAYIILKSVASCDKEVMSLKIAVVSCTLDRGQSRLRYSIAYTRKHFYKIEAVAHRE